MKIFVIGKMLLVTISSIALLAACGSGSKDLNGSLTIDTDETDATTYKTVEFTIEYTNPYTDNVLGTEITVKTSGHYLDGEMEQIPELKDTFEYSTNNSGKTIYIYSLPKVNRPYNFRLEAKTGDLDAANGVSVSALVITVTAFTATPSSVTFDANTVKGDKIQVLLSGGTPPYKVQNINPSPNKFISASITENILTLTIIREDKDRLVDGSASIFMLDSASSPATLQLPVTVKAFSASTLSKASFR